jgi:hypothetical protein
MGGLLVQSTPLWPCSTLERNGKSEGIGAIKPTEWRTNGGSDSPAHVGQRAKNGQTCDPSYDAQDACPYCASTKREARRLQPPSSLLHRSSSRTSERSLCPVDMNIFTLTINC